ncbi:MAG: hypothetical protein R2745_21550 [Vicinamibacterales bacterium]
MDIPRVKPSRTEVWTSRTATWLGVAAVCVTPIVAAGAWLLVTDPVLAADVAATGDPWPLVRAIADAIGDVMRYVLDL